jgi:hypothetical protein
MLNKLVQNYILNSILSSLKGKKRWLVILVLVIAQLAQSAGVDVSDFVADVVNILETNAEG